MLFAETQKRARIRARRWRSVARHLVGETRQWVRGAARGPESVLVVLGCQRSGTTLMTRLLARDANAKVYPEHSGLTARDAVDRLRLAPLDVVARRVAASRFPLVVLKPLVETQNAPRLLASLPNAHGLWMFRHWTDVARSNLARFGEANGIKNLRSVMLRRPDDWRSQGVSGAVHRMAHEYFSEDMNPLDAAALFWWVRNTLFFELGLDSDERVRTCCYEELVTEPVRVLEGLYGALGLPFPGEEILQEVSASSVGLGSDLSFSPAVVQLCDEMWLRLRAAHEKGSRCA